MDSSDALRKPDQPKEKRAGCEPSDVRSERSARNSPRSKQNGTSSVDSPGGSRRTARNPGGVPFARFKRPAPAPKYGPRTRFSPLKAKINVRGLAAIDARTLAARTLLDWRRELLADVGGDEASAAKRALVDVAVRTRLLLDHVDAILLEQDTLVSRARKLFPVVEQRQRLADSLVRQLQVVGLDRHKPAAPTLDEYLAGREGGA
jgi:hypothetical protein